MRCSCRRRGAYKLKPMGIRWIARAEKIKNDERQEWCALYGDRTLEDVFLQSLRLFILQKCDGNRSQTAEILGISIRCLHTNLNRYRSYGADILDAPIDKYRTPLPRNFWENLFRLLKRLSNAF